jgi:DMATS type aromatic prenyltransferase
MSQATSSREPISETAFGLGRRKLAALCDAVGLAQKDRIVGTFDELSAFCPDLDLALPPRWSSVTDDCTPYEFSVVFNRGQPNVRVVVEAQRDPASPQTYWSAAKALNDWLRHSHQIDFAKLELIEDLFVPTDPSAYWAMCHGVDFRRDGPPLFKLYLNPLAQGASRADDIVCEALSRLGLSGTWPSLMAIRAKNGQFTHFSLDLSSAPGARIKVYIRRRNATLDELDACLAIATRVRQRDWSSFCKTFARVEDTLSLRPIFVAYHATVESPDRLQNAVLHMPAFPYAQNDGVAYDRIRRLLVGCGLPTHTYRRCVEALADGPLGSQQGLHSFVSFQRRRQYPQITVYFGARAYYSRYGGIALDPEHCWPSPVT